MSCWRRARCHRGRPGCRTEVALLPHRCESIYNSSRKGTAIATHEWTETGPGERPMKPIHLDPQQRRELERRRHETRDKRIYERLSAVLWVASWLPGRLHSRGYRSKPSRLPRCRTYNPSPILVATQGAVNRIRRVLSPEPTRPLGLVSHRPAANLAALQTRFLHFYRPSASPTYSKLAVNRDVLLVSASIPIRW